MYKPRVSFANARNHCCWYHHSPLLPFLFLSPLGVTCNLAITAVSQDTQSQHWCTQPSQPPTHTPSVWERMKCEGALQEASKRVGWESRFQSAWLPEPGGLHPVLKSRGWGWNLKATSWGCSHSIQDPHSGLPFSLSPAHHGQTTAGSKAEWNRPQPLVSWRDGTGSGCPGFGVTECVQEG